MSETVQGVLLPLIGTSLGAACVFPMRREPCAAFRKALSGFAAGVMTAAGVWSLLLPAIEISAPLGKMAFLPAATGLLAGVLLMILLERLINTVCERMSGKLSKNTMLTLAVTLHNIPEGMVVGAAFAGVGVGGHITAAAAMALATGIAIQNFPEGAMISLPLKSGGTTRARAFVIGVLSGVVEPIGAVVTLMAAELIAPALPYFLSLAAGAMYYVAAAELIPESAEGYGGAVSYAAGFAVMMSLDVMFG